MTSPKEILKKAQAEHYAIGAFNFSTAEVLKAIVAVAKQLNAPVILSTSEKEAEFVGWREAVALVQAWRTATKLPLILNLDHGKSLASVQAAIEAGYNAVHFDGSELPYEENIKQTKEVIDYIRGAEKDFSREILVEGELGYLRGSSTVHNEPLEVKESDLTAPWQAQDFVAQTGVDSLAIVIGNAHGIFVQGQEILNLERLAQIKEAVGEKFLVLHGGSGIGEGYVKKAIEQGIVKININTELRVAYQTGIKKEIAAFPRETTPYKILQPAFEAVKKVVMDKIWLFGSAGKA